MVGFGPRKLCEPVYRQLLEGLTDEALERELRHISRMMETTPNGPHYEDMWKLECLKYEFTKRRRIPSGGF
jgi:hypothetical protein